MPEAFSQISAAHYCLGPEVITNQSLEERFGEKAFASIAKMSGIQTRRIAAENITSSDLAYCAAKRLVEIAGISPNSIDCLIFASQTPDHIIPPTSSILHHRLGLSSSCLTLDIGIGCPAFPYAMATVDGLIAAGRAKRALVLMADTVSKLLNPMDRTLIPLHGDGAAAILVEPSTCGCGFIGMDFGVKSSGWEHIVVPAGGARLKCSAETTVEEADETGVIRNREQLYMNGPAVFQFSVSVVPEAITNALNHFGESLESIDLVILHQANKTMLELIYKRLRIPPEKHFYFLEEVGNLAAASSPVALTEALRQGKISPGSKTLVVSFGNGLNWGVSLHQWGAVLPAFDREVSVEYTPE